MIDNTMLAATSASSNNPAALTMLALISLSFAEPINSRSQSALGELIDKWGKTILGVDPVVVDTLTTQLRAIGVSLDEIVGPFKQAS